MEKALNYILLPIVFIIGIYLMWDVYLFYAIALLVLLLLYPFVWAYSKVIDFIQGKHLD